MGSFDITVVMHVERNDIHFAIDSGNPFDAPEHPGAPMRPGAYISRVINRDEVSDPATTVLQGSATPLPISERAKPVAGESRKREFPPVWPALIPRRHAPSFVKQAGSPNPPEGSGIALSVKLMQPPGKDSTCLLQGSFRLSARFGRYIPLDKRSTDKTKPVETVRMPVHILVTGNATPLAFTARMMIPTYHAVKDPKDAAPVTGYFNFDLLDYADLRKTPQTYYIYLFSGDTMSGPLPLALEPGAVA
jgi:hypothetical protein